MSAPTGDQAIACVEELPDGTGGRAQARRGASSRPFVATERDAWAGFLCTHTQLLRKLDEELEATERIPLSSYEVLMKLAEAPGHRLRMKDIASMLLVSRSGLTRIVHDLERRGYVERHKCTEDGRGLEAVLTPEGRKVFRRAEKVFLTHLRESFLDKLSDAQLTALGEIWAAVSLDEPGTVPE
ncbi:MarR family winged helix-turn-helix transcriptional regulator [Streptomyces sp. GQFP]|uniref:MarR family winged helix-turn-helix transcriptional regulator n=1 Tax=Streptomyces sp. GQFP TaxID=2907545 RepID=UPI001F47A77E|nr:MarR family transcriptional regulator [Streptomyces sp. GQFP]UIX31946.1 MarR family transcriptional regulator [Streptomyces sp. GQFP]